MQEVLQRLLQQAATEFPEVQFSPRPPRHDPEPPRAATPTRRGKPPNGSSRSRPGWEQEWLKQHYFQPFTTPDGTPAIKQDHVRIALESRSELAPLADQLKQQGTTETEARQKTVVYILDFIQTIPISCSTASPGRSGKGFFKPASGCWSRTGDCDSKVTLMAALLAQLFPN